MPRVRLTLRFTAALSMALSACSASPAPDAPVYPAIELSPGVPTLNVAEGVVSLELPCSDVELDNGIDDDCDGHIDEPLVHATGELELALSWSADEALELSTEPTLDAEIQRSACEPPQACLARLVSTELPPHSELHIQLHRPARASAEDGSDAPIAVSLSVAARGKNLGTHNLALAPGESRRVAQLTVP